MNTESEQTLLRLTNNIAAAFLLIENNARQVAKFTTKPQIIQCLEVQLEAIKQARSYLDTLRNLREADTE